VAEVEQKKRGRTLTGTVVSNKGHQTITVVVERRVAHPVYGKIIRRSTKVHAHDPSNECNVGDVVTVRESRPISKTKHWVLERIDERAAVELPRIEA
jgi:small subunit ribosomal protein S17